MLRDVRSDLSSLLSQQDAANTAEKNADSTAEDATKKAGQAAHDATKKVHETKDNVDLPSKIDQATDRAVKETKEAPEKAGSAAGKTAQKVWSSSATCHHPFSSQSDLIEPCIAFLALKHVFQCCVASWASPFCNSFHMGASVLPRRMSPLPYTIRDAHFLHAVGPLSFL